MMRQYDLIERVQALQSRHQRGAAQPRLCLRHEGARRAEARLRRPLFLPSARSRGDPDRSQARRRHHRRGACCTTRSRIPPTTRAEIDQMFGPDIGTSGRGPDQAQEARPRHQGGEAGGEPAQAPAGDRRRRAGAAGQARRPAAQHAHAVSTCRRRRAAASPRRRSISMRRSPAAWACTRCARSSRIWRSASSIPKPTRWSASASTALERATSDLIAEIEQQLTRKLADRGIAAEVKGRRKRAYSIWRKMERKSIGFEQLSDIFGFRVIVEDDPRVLPGARHRAHHLADGAGPLQGLRLDAEAERLPLDPHHRDRSGQAARRAADPHRGDARDRRIRHRRARALQGRRRIRRPSCCRANRTPMPGCAAPSSCSPRAPIRRSSSSTPSSNCSTTRCSASRPRAS